jgi:hypothetical protein
MIDHLQRVSDSIVTKFNKSEIDPILLENAYHSPEESEEDPDDSTDNNRITIKDLRWRSDSVSLRINFFFTNCIY